MKDKSKKSKKSVLVLVLLLMFISILIVSCYIHFFNKKSYTFTKFKDENINNTVYQGSVVLTKGKYNYLVVRKNDNWYEVLKNTSEENIGFHVLGAYNDKLYYADSDGINYVDVDKNLKVLSFVQNDYSSDNIFMAVFSDNKMYVEVENNLDDDNVLYSIIEYDLDSSYEYKKGKKIMTIKNGPVNFFVAYNKIFYLDSYKSDEYKLMSYSISNNKTSVVMNNVCGIDKYKNNLIVTKVDSKSEDEECSLYYLYNVNKGIDKFITNKISHVVLDDALYFQDDKKIYIFDEKNLKVKYLMDGKMNYSGDFLYYLKDNKIYKYDNSKSSIIYSDDDSEIRGFTVSNTTGVDILFIYTKDGSFAIVDGKKYSLENDNDVLKYKVNMKDGNTEVFSYYGFNDSAKNFDSNITYEEYLDEE